ncbi:MAG: PrsW family intramembrane metalloprotease [Propionibacteriales bacterium]|nr:PrsW family intramembrane metalloprotease [Propionibacteriales bacterium]
MPPAWQPARRRTWLVVLTSIVLGLGAVAVAALLVISGGPEAALVGFGLAVIPVPFVVMTYLWLDRYEPEPWSYLVSAFGFGAIIATTIGVVFTMLGAKASGLDGDDMAGVVWAPITEEFGKGLFILLVVLLRRQQMHGLLDGIVYAGMVGIGFAFTENILYYMQTYLGESPAGGRGIEATSALFFLRGVMAPFSHPLFTAAIGIGFGIAVYARRWVTRIGAPLIGYAVAVGLHSAWNASAFLGEGWTFLATYAVGMMPALAFVLGLALWVRRREGRVLAAALADCAARGWLHPDEIPWIASLSHRATARSYAKIRHGRPTARAVKEYQQAVTELGFLHDRILRGSPPKGHLALQAAIRGRIAMWRPNVVLPPPLPRVPRHLYAHPSG